MAQPPEARDGRHGPDGPDPETPPPDAATIAWQPPDPGPPAGGEEPGMAPPLTPPAGQPYFPGAATPDGPPSPADPSPAPDQGPAQNPLISWAPSGDPAPSSAADTPAPLVGWQVPEQRVVETAAGYTLAGIGPRLVAYFLDSILVGLIPTILSLVLIDYGAYLRDVMDSMAIDPATGMPASPITSVPITTEVVLITVISTAISFLYFVGFWTSGGQATPGMRGLRMRLVDVTGGTTLSIGQATKRWVGYGAPLALLAFVPPFQAIAGLVQLGISLILLITAATDDRRQGLHDRWANSIVIRSTTSGAGATALGCLLVILIGIGFLFVVSTITLGAIAPDLFDLIETYEAVP
jgi:uncharacterized RDD family membrane protein YckC